VLLWAARAESQSGWLRVKPRHYTENIEQKIYQAHNNDDVEISVGGSGRMALYPFYTL
jgi:hypothetical protein